MGLFAFIKSLKKTPPKALVKYSYEWIDSLSPTQWELEREIVRKQLPTVRYGEKGWMKQAVDLERLLRLFDRVKRDQYDAAHPGQVWTPPAHREGGWYINHRN